MEDTLGVYVLNYISDAQVVLILILMEDALGDTEDSTLSRRNPDVLILILMEDALGEQKIDLSDNQCITINFLQKPFNFHKN